MVVPPPSFFKWNVDPADVETSHLPLSGGRKHPRQSFPTSVSGDGDPLYPQERLFRAPKPFIFTPRCYMDIMFLCVLCCKKLKKKGAEQERAEQEDGGKGRHEQPHPAAPPLSLQTPEREVIRLA